MNLLSFPNTGHRNIDEIERQRRIDEAGQFLLNEVRKMIDSGVVNKITIEAKKDQEEFENEIKHHFRSFRDKK